MARAESEVPIYRRFLRACTAASRGGLIDHGDYGFTLQKNPVNIKANYAKRVDKWNIRRIREYPADFRLQIYPEIRLSKNGNNIWKYKLRFKDLKELGKLFRILESQLKNRYILTIYGKSKIGGLSRYSLAAR